MLLISARIFDYTVKPVSLSRIVTLGSHDVKLAKKWKRPLLDKKAHQTRRNRASSNSAPDVVE